MGMGQFRMGSADGTFLEWLPANRGIRVMEDVRYQVLVTGRIAERCSREEALLAFAELLCISPPEAAARFEAAPFVVRGHLSLAQAEKYQRVISRRGIECEVREETDRSVRPGLTLSER